MTDIDKIIAIAQPLQIALGTEGIHTDLYASLRVADSLHRNGIEPRDDRHRVGPLNTDHRALVDYIKTDGDIAAWCIRQFVNDGKKIAAIKILRSVSGCGLKEAKEAVEDYTFARGF